jgi:hypothetical protein
MIGIVSDTPAHIMLCHCWAYLIKMYKSVIEEHIVWIFTIIEGTTEKVFYIMSDTLPNLANSDNN